MVPAVIDDQPVQRRHREDHAERRALRQDCGRQCALLVRKPFVDGMCRHGERRPLAGAENDAADQQRGETDGADHRKLRQRPDDGEHQQHPARRHPVDDEADDDRRNGEQEEERGAEQAERLRLELELGHDRDAGQTDHDLVGEIHQHEQKQQERDLPGALGRRLRGHFLPRLVTYQKSCWSGVSPMLAMAFRVTQPAFVRGRTARCYRTAARQPPDGVANEGHNRITIASAMSGCRDLLRLPCYGPENPREPP